MKNRIVTIIGLFALLSTASAAGPKADFNVIPVPRTICAGTSAPFVLDSNTKIYYEEGQKRNDVDIALYRIDREKVPDYIEMYSPVCEAGRIFYDT